MILTPTFSNHFVLIWFTVVDSFVLCLRCSIIFFFHCFFSLSFVSFLILVRSFFPIYVAYLILSYFIFASHRFSCLFVFPFFFVPLITCSSSFPKSSVSFLYFSYKHFSFIYLWFLSVPSSFLYFSSFPVPKSRFFYFIMLSSIHFSLTLSLSLAFLFFYILFLSLNSFPFLSLYIPLFS